MNTIIESDKEESSIAAVCHPCVINQTRSAARFAELTEEQTEKVINVVNVWLDESKKTPLLVQHIVRYAADAIIQEHGESLDFDIYAEVKKKSNLLAISYAKGFQKKIDDSDTPLEVGMQIAAAGNIIDFGAIDHTSLNLDEELRLLDKTPFAHYDIEAFIEILGKASLLLYICDNSGEIVFDMLFIKEIERAYPNLQIIAAVRGKPIINDATLKDAKAVKLDRLVTTISSGSVYPGTILPETTEEFQELYASADVILSKGQGNLETLLPIADKRVFFLLRIKCELMASVAKVRKDSLVLMQGSKFK